MIQTERIRRLESPPNTPRLDKLEAEAERLRRKEARARRKAEKLERKIRRLRDAAWAASSSGAASARGGGGGRRPTGVSALRRLLDEDAARVWSAAELHEELRVRGWLSSTAVHHRQSVEAVISRLVRRGEVERLSPGRFRPLPGRADTRGPYGYPE